jgi:hypothetical protein
MGFGSLPNKTTRYQRLAKHFHHRQSQRHGGRASDPGGNLRERHQLQPVARGQDRDIAGAKAATSLSRGVN